MLIYTDLAHAIIEDIARTAPQMAHLQPEAIAVAAAPRWAGSPCGHLGRCYALQERPGRPTFNVWVGARTRRIIEVSEWYRYEPVEVNQGGRRCRYLIELHLPRMLEHDPLETLMHELWHIGEGFDGQLRPMRHGRRFDWHVTRLMREWRARGDRRLVELAGMGLEQLRREFGVVLARRLPGGFKSWAPAKVEPPFSYEEGVAKFYPRYRLTPDFKVSPLKQRKRMPRARLLLEECPVRSYEPEGSADLPKAMARYLPRDSWMRRERLDSGGSAAFALMRRSDAVYRRDMALTEAGDAGPGEKQEPQVFPSLRPGLEEHRPPGIQEIEQTTLFGDLDQALEA